MFFISNVGLQNSLVTYETNINLLFKLKCTAEVYNVICVDWYKTPVVKPCKNSAKF